MKAVVLIVLICGGGCTRWTAAQIDLVTQARRGIVLVAESDQERDRALSELSQLRRQRIDEAFDADARARGALDADWVIEARQAYGVAIDALVRQSAAGDAAARQRRRNLADIDAALTRLQWLQAIQLKLTPTLFSNPEEKP